MSHILLDGVSCVAPDGSLLFPPLHTAIADEKIGLFGRNGAGKSTLLAAIAAAQRPDARHSSVTVPRAHASDPGGQRIVAGTITCDGRAAMMRQATFARGLTIAAALGIADRLARLDRIESGMGDTEDFAAADWNLPARVEGVLSAVELNGRTHTSKGTASGQGEHPLAWLAEPVATLGGGEKSRVKLARALLEEPDILLLDEPTNDMDEAGRAMVARILAQWDGPALVASHDRDLLDQMDRIIELSSTGGLAVTGGWHAFVQEREAARGRAQRALDQAKSVAHRAKASHQSRREASARSASKGRIAAARRGDTKLEINAKRHQSDRGFARRIHHSEAQIDAANTALGQARRAVERITPIRIELPPSGLMPGHRLIAAEAITCSYDGRPIFGPLDFEVTGPQRIAITGPNGCGKTSLLRIISGAQAPTSGTLTRSNARIAVLDQHLSLLQHGETALDAMMHHLPHACEHDCHAALARFGFRAQWAARSTNSLSGGERVRLALACLFSAPRGPDLLVLDEPTNHLDIEAIELLEAALAQFDGAIICVSHDRAFCTALGLNRIWQLGGL